MKVRIPNFFSIKQATDLVRIGRNYDGGYLVSKSDIQKTDTLIGLGINPDRVSTISYGKERPAVVGSNDGAWAQNRRSVTLVN